MRIRIMEVIVRKDCWNVGSKSSHHLNKRVIADQHSVRCASH